MQLDPVTRARYLEGDWAVGHEGHMFNRAWFSVVDVAPAKLRRVRRWDLASTPLREGQDPDWTAGVLLGLDEGGTFYILDVVRSRLSPQGVERLIANTASFDTEAVPIIIEQEPGASGASLVSYYQRRVLQRYAVRGVRPSGDKTTRAAPFASQAEAGNVVLVRGAWNGDFLDEAETFPFGGHDDQLDAAVGGFEALTGGGTAYQHAYVTPYKPPVIRKGDLTLVGDRYVDQKPRSGR
jgi:predicted phage terminase large subunit-like protein